MLAVSGPGSGQALLDQPLVDAFPLLGINVVEEPTAGVLGARSTLDPNVVARQFTKPAGRLVVARLSPFGGIHAKEADPPRGTVEGVAVDDPGDRQ
jgi:hypothetical protein